MDEPELIDDFHYNDSYRSTLRKPKTWLIILSILLLITTFIISIVSLTRVNTLDDKAITSIIPLQPNKRDILQGSGLLIDQQRNLVKLENTGIYDASGGPGIIVDKPMDNYLIISLNQSYVNNNVNTTCECNQTGSLTADNGIILSNNPWNPMIGDANISISLNSLNQGNGIIISGNQYDPASGVANISVNMTYINENIISGSLSSNSTDISITPSSWNPISGQNGGISVNSYGFNAVFTTASFSWTAGSILGGWNTAQTGCWNDGFFNPTTGIYNVSSTGNYDIFVLIQVSGAGTVDLRFNSTASIYRISPASSRIIIYNNAFIQAGASLRLVTSVTRTVTGSTTAPFVTWFSVKKNVI